MLNLNFTCDARRPESNVESRTLHYSCSRHDAIQCLLKAVRIASTAHAIKTGARLYELLLYIAI